MPKRQPDAPEQPTYFLDANIQGADLAAKLDAAGLQVERLIQHFKHDVTDEEWIPKVAEKGWWAVTCDSRIRHNRNEFEAHLRANGILLVIRGQNLGIDAWAQMIVRAHARLPAFIGKRCRPMIINLHQARDFECIQGGERRGGVRK